MFTSMAYTFGPPCGASPEICVFTPRCGSNEGIIAQGSSGNNCCTAGNTGLPKRKENAARMVLIQEPLKADRHREPPCARITRQFLSQAQVVRQGGHLLCDLSRVAHCRSCHLPALDQLPALIGPVDPEYGYGSAFSVSQVIARIVQSRNGSLRHLVAVAEADGGAPSGYCNVR